MRATGRSPKVLALLGLAAMVVGAIDPLEGAFVIMPGVALVTLAARLSRSRHLRLIGWSLLLVAAGVGAMIVLSALGGVGGRSGRSPWWSLVILPYPVGWIMGIVGAIRMWREPPA